MMYGFVKFSNMKNWWIPPRPHLLSMTIALTGWDRHNLNRASAVENKNPETGSKSKWLASSSFYSLLFLDCRIHSYTVIRILLFRA